MTSPSYHGRHHAARHSAGRRALRVPRAFTSSFVLPTVAAGALVVTATGAAVAESAPMAPRTPLTLDLSAPQSEMARTQQAVDDEMVTELALRRQDASMQTAALAGRAEAKVKAARAAERKALLAKKEAAKAAAKAKREAKMWVRPIKVWHKTSNFGWRWGKTHDGIDLGAPTGTPLYAMSEGRVIGSFFDSSFGNKVEIQYWDGSISWYGHMSKRVVSEGQTVRPGELVGLVGNTGHSFGSHLHFEMQQSTEHDTPVAPEPWLRSKGLL